MNPITYTRAVLVTGRNERDNEYTYWQIENEWFDGFEEKFVTAEHIAKVVYPNITIVRFGNLKLTRAEWLALDAPLELSSEQMNDLMTIDCYVSGRRTLNVEPATLPEMVAGAYMDGMQYAGEDADWQDEQDTRESVRPL